MTHLTAQPQAPSAARKPKNLSIHGHTRTDPYFWLNERENPEVISYLEAENAYTKSGLAHTEALQEKLFGEIKGRIKEDDASVPVQLRGYYYYTRYETGREYPLHCRKKGSLDAAEEIMLDENLLAEGQSFCQVVGLTVSPDNNWLVYGADFVGRRKYEMYVKNLTTGEVRKEVGDVTDGSYVWVNDNKTLYYDVKDEVTLRTYRIMRHTLGQDPKKDNLVFEEKDETFGCGVSRSKSDAYIFIYSYSTTTSETRYAPASEPAAKFKVFQPRQRDHLYDVEHYGPHFYIRTNINNSRNFKIMKTPLTATDLPNWTDVMPYRGDVLIERFDVFRDYLVVEERYDGLTRLRVRSWAGNSDYFIQFDEPSYTAYMHNNPEFNTVQFRYGYSSLVQPATVYEINMLSKERKTLKVQEVPGGYDASQYTCERVWVNARDGARVPVSLVYKKAAFKGEESPLLLYGYGSYGITVDPYFSVARLSLLDRGFVFAIAHIRGGQDMGRQWYEAGKMLYKKNTFNDFVDCAEYLIANKYTSKGHLYAMGGSAGGLLMGAVVNMRPDLWNGIVASVPFVDVVTTMLDESIPLTTGEFDEWGNPKNKEYYDYILSYSPYDNVKAVNYPNMLVTTGLHDSQVQYWEPAKWVARLRELKTDSNRLYLHTEMDAGHGGKSGRFERLREIAMEYAFLLDCEGIKE